MWHVIRRNPFAAFLAIVLHVVLFSWLLFGIDWKSEPVVSKPPVDVVQARVVDRAKLDAEVEKMRAAEARKKAETEAARRREDNRLAELQRKQTEEKKRLMQLETERKAKEKADAKRRAEQQQRREQEGKRLAQEKKEKAEREKKRRAEEKRKAESEKKRKAAEAKRKAEEKKRKQAEAKRKAEEKKRKQAEAKARAEQQAREAALQAKMEAEHNARERSRYVVAIKQQIEGKWLRPQNTGKDLRCTVRVRLIPSGDVIAVSVVESSGNPAFDRSVESAVRKAAPLPVPSGGLFESFRDLMLVFDPY